jgi:hypothetical protein
MKLGLVLGSSTRYTLGHILTVTHRNPWSALPFISLWDLMPDKTSFSTTSTTEVAAVYVHF